MYLFFVARMKIDKSQFTVSRGVQGAPCTGLLKVRIDQYYRRICAKPEYFNQASAQRLCFTLGLDMDREPGTNDGVRLYR